MKNFNTDATELRKECYWIMFDYIRVLLFPVAHVERASPTWPLNPGAVMWDGGQFELTFESKAGLMYSTENQLRLDEFVKMQRFISRSGDAQSRREVAGIFRRRKEHREYTVFLTVLEKLMTAGEISADDCIGILSKAENQAAMVELLKFCGEQGIEAKETARFEL